MIYNCHKLLFFIEDDLNKPEVVQKLGDNCSIRVYGSVLVGLCVPSFSICIPGFSID